MRQKKKKSKILKQYSNKITAVLSSSKTALNYKQICMRLGVHDPKSRADVISCLQFLLIDTVITEEMRVNLNCIKQLNITLVFLIPHQEARVILEWNI